MCKRLHDCSMLDSLAVQELIADHGWSAYGLLQALLDECFKQSTGKIVSTAKVLARALRCEEGELSKVLSACLSLSILAGKHDASTGVWTLSHPPTTADKEAYSQRKQGFSTRAAKAAQARHKQKVGSATSIAQAGSLNMLGEEEEVEVKEEVRSTNVTKKDLVQYLPQGYEEGSSPHPTPDLPLRKRGKLTRHGEHGHVLLSEAEFQGLATDWSEPERDFWIRELDEGIEGKGYKYKNHNLVVRQWQRRDPSRFLANSNGAAASSPRIREALERQQRLAVLDQQEAETRRLA